MKSNNILVTPWKLAWFCSVKQLQKEDSLLEKKMANEILLLLKAITFKMDKLYN